MIVHFYGALCEFRDANSQFHDILAQTYHSTGVESMVLAVGRKVQFCLIDTEKMKEALHTFFK
jgi:hypothetical protein